MESCTLTTNRKRRNTVTIQDAIARARATQEADDDGDVAITRNVEGKEFHYFLCGDDTSDESADFYPDLSVAAVLDNDWKVLETVPEQSSK